MTIRDRFWVAGAEVGFDVVLGEPTVLDCESEGEARASLVAPPPLLDAPPPPCDAVGKAAAEEASCEEDWDAMVLVREDSSWLVKGCCPEREGENGDEMDEAEDFLLATCRVEGGGKEGKLEDAGEKPARALVGEGVFRCSGVKVVEMGVRRVLWCCRAEPQGYCWLI